MALRILAAAALLTAAAADGGGGPFHGHIGSCMAVTDRELCEAIRCPRDQSRNCGWNNAMNKCVCQLKTVENGLAHDKAETCGDYDTYRQCMSGDMEGNFIGGSACPQNPSMKCAWDPTRTKGRKCYCDARVGTGNDGRGFCGDIKNKIQCNDYVGCPSAPDSNGISYGGLCSWDDNNALEYGGRCRCGQHQAHDVVYSSCEAIKDFGTCQRAQCPNDPSKRCLWADGGCGCMKQSVYDPGNTRLHGTQRIAPEQAYLCGEFTDPDSCAQANCPAHPQYRHHPQKKCRWDASFQRNVGACVCDIGGRNGANCRDYRTKRSCHNNPCPENEDNLCQWDNQRERCDCDATISHGAGFFLGGSNTGGCGAIKNKIQCNDPSQVCPHDQTRRCTWDKAGGDDGVEKCVCGGPRGWDRGGHFAIESCDVITNVGTCERTQCPKDHTRRCTWHHDQEGCRCGPQHHAVPAWLYHKNPVAAEENDNRPGAGRGSYMYGTLATGAAEGGSNDPRNAGTNYNVFLHQAIDIDAKFHPHYCTDFKTQATCDTQNCPQNPGKECRWNAQTSTCGCDTHGRSCSEYTTWKSCERHYCPRTNLGQVASNAGPLRCVWDANASTILHGLHNAGACTCPDQRPSGTYIEYPQMPISATSSEAGGSPMASGGSVRSAHYSLTTNLGEQGEEGIHAQGGPTRPIIAASGGQRQPWRDFSWVDVFGWYPAAARMQARNAVSEILDDNNSGGTCGCCGCGPMLCSECTDRLLAVCCTGEGTLGDHPAGSFLGNVAAGMAGSDSFPVNTLGPFGVEHLVNNGPGVEDEANLWQAGDRGRRDLYLRQSGGVVSGGMNNVNAHQAHNH